VIEGFAVITEGFVKVKMDLFGKITIDTNGNQQYPWLMSSYSINEN